MTSYAELEEDLRQCDAEIERLDKLLRAAGICPTCGGVPASHAHPLWPIDWKPQGPDHVPPGFCSGICGPRGSSQVQPGTLEEKLERYAQLAWEICHNSDWDKPDPGDRRYSLQVITEGNAKPQQAECNELGEYTLVDGTEVYPILVLRDGESMRTFNPQEHRDGS